MRPRGDALRLPPGTGGRPRVRSPGPCPWKPAGPRPARPGCRAVAALGTRLERRIPPIEQRFDCIASATEWDALGLLKLYGIELRLDITARPAVDGHSVSLARGVTEVDFRGHRPSALRNMR